MIFPEQTQSTGYVYDPTDFTKVYFFGDYLRKTSHLLADSEKKWEIVCAATDVQSTEWPSLEAYHDNLKKIEKKLTDYIQINEDPFVFK